MASLTPAALAALTKVQARIKGWAQRNKLRAARLEEAKAAGGPHALFADLSPHEKLRDVFPCGLASIVARGSLYVFDKHMCYHASAKPAGMYSAATDEVVMTLPLSQVAHVAVKQEFTEPGIVVTAVTDPVDKSSATKLWWGGMYSP